MPSIIYPDGLRSTQRHSSTKVGLAAATETWVIDGNYRSVVILGTATPVQTDIEELWDLLEILNQGADHVLGRPASKWRNPPQTIPVITGQRQVDDEVEQWNWLRNPLPAKIDDKLFDLIRQDLRLKPERFYSDKPLTDLETFTRDELRDSIAGRVDGLSFLERTIPFFVIPSSASARPSKRWACSTGLQ